ncbi:MAG: translocation/assembly module TamB domain-containing protein [Prevotella sp.]|nr:translocation/assembly module TamB domain-containing protein [Prevotella sp.]
MKIIRKIINYFIWTVVAIYFAITVFLHIPAFQGLIGSEVASALAEKLGTKVEVGRVDLGFLNRIIIDDVHIYDQKNKPMLQATRLSAKVDIIPLFRGKISISSAQLFGIDARLYRTSPNTPPNFQFVIDSLKSKDTSSHTPLDLRINSLVIRNGKARWDNYIPRKGDGLDINHLSVSDISAHILLHHITDNNLDVAIKRFSLKEASGLDLRQLSFKAKVDKHQTTVEDFTIELPSTHIFFPIIHAAYKFDKNGLERRSLQYSIKLSKSYVAPTDLAFIEPTLKTFHNRVRLNADINGTGNSVKVNNIDIEADDQSIIIRGNGEADNINGTPRWTFRTQPLRTSADGIQFIARNLRKHKIEIPEPIIRLGNIYFRGTAFGQGKHITTKGDIRTDAGNVSLDAKYDNGHFEGFVKTSGFQLGHILNNKDFGLVIADVTAKGYLPTPFRLDRLDVAANGTVARFDYRGYAYRNVSVDGTFRNTTFTGKASIDDPNGKAHVEGTLNKNKVLASLEANSFNPYRLKLTDALGNRAFSLKAKANLTGTDLDHLNGSVDVSDFSAIGERKNYTVKMLHAKVSNNHRLRSADVESDFGELHISGVYDYQTLPGSIMSIAGHHMPSLFASKSNAQGNAFTIHGRMVSAELLRKFFGIPLHVNGPIDINGTVNDKAHAIDLRLNAPDITYSGNHIKDIHLALETSNSGQGNYSGTSALNVNLSGERISDSGTPLSIGLKASAINDDIRLTGNWDINGITHNHGTLNANAHLFRDAARGLGVSVDILPSEEVFDTIAVAVQPSHLTYQHNLLDIDHFEVSNGSQHVVINGQTTGSEQDSLLVDFKNINLGYVLDLVDFHSVEFTGNVTGKGYVKSFFKNPQAYAVLDVDDFRFQGGEFGVLHAKATYDNNEKKISFTSVADDGPDCYTNVNGYVSIKDHYLNIPMVCHGTKMQFLEGFAGAVMDNVKATGVGNVRLFGDLSYPNMEGDVVCNGDIDIKQTKTTYTMHNAPVHIIPDHLIFKNDTIYDRNDNIGIVNGSLDHDNFKDFKYNIHVSADNLLCLNRPDFDDNTFRGVIYAVGKCDIKGKSGETTINANLTPVGDSYMEYNAGYSGTPDDNSFIHWHDATAYSNIIRPGGTTKDDRKDSLVTEQDVKPVNGTAITDTTNNSRNMTTNAGDGGLLLDFPDIPGDFTMNIIVNTTPDFTLRVLMDPTTGDHMDFHGNGVIRSTYYNKGAFQMFGNYDVEYGNYTMTIQNLVKKVFTFQPGSSITFGGNPFDARLNLKAQYTVNGVSLSDLQMGRSFTSSNIRVNCLMNITGKPLKPTITFGIDLPTLSSDAQQMVRSVMNSEEDMNQQVLYLLAVGRFYNPGTNNAEVESNQSQNRTSLAMQSVLSGALSQQLSNIMSTVLHNTNWNIGANISTGEEGWSDAEYEGLLSGHMLNNRLFFQGQFGYRDKVTTNNSSFIGDFDLRYLLTPNGNIAVRVYNQTNDRYFTRNSLTTQGLGFVFKKDFSSIRDLFRRSSYLKKSKKKNKRKNSKK